MHLRNRNRKRLSNSAIGEPGYFCYFPRMSEEAAKIIVREEFELKKWDGEPPQEGEHKDPVEVRKLVYENGRLVSDTVTTKGA